MKTKYIINIDWKIGNIYKSVYVTPNGRRTIRLYGCNWEHKADITNLDSTAYDLLMLEAWENNAVVETVPQRVYKASTACDAQYID